MAKRQTQITPENLADNIRQLRAEAQISQRALAAATGIAEHTIIRIEAGENSPSFANVSAIFNALDKKIYIK